MNNKKIIVGLSGGVDSSVTALLLKQQGYQVSAVYMQNWEVENDDPYCTAEQDLLDARTVCDHLDISLQVINFAKEYWQHVFQYCLDEFSVGRTPNPDIYCNREIKFKYFLAYALSLGADYIATGHYARIRYQDDHFHLCKADDPNKDQSYFLYTLGQQQLSRCLFPLGEYQKPQVRQLAAQAGLINHNKKDSTGICFIGERKFKDFLGEFLLAKPGVIKTEHNEVIGKHDGLMFHTIGQRKGLNIGGRKETTSEPWYVLAKDIATNTLIVGQGHDHQLLYSSSLICKQLSWVTGKAPTMPLQCVAKTRYRQPDQACQVEYLDNNSYQVNFTEPQRAITSGQSVVFYQGSICVGGGIIQ